MARVWLRPLPSSAFSPLYIQPEGGRGQWGEGFQELLQRTQGQNQGGGWKQGREVGLAGVGLGSGGEKMQTTVIEQQ